ncbi:U32 family peptidase [Clostridium sp. MSJ-8]|uniref:peptidase U32 family protein n=1 Tax=Clostridium sp. MSJ-8 TaxID=2841510 RepID=UPI001C0EBE1B|nr:U32 family peptidase [Clostridium sp. MSJ-8]
MVNKKVEILAPAGNLEKLKTAIDFGADAVYLGGSKLNLRAFADNFTNDEIRQGVEYAHARGRKVYVTLNVFPHNSDLVGLEDYLRELYELNVDAILASDPSVIITSLETVPELEVHLSTQANNVNYKTAQYWYKQGVKRIVLARELSLNEIKEIHDRVPEGCELEAFVHGSMCMSYSGRCLMSNYMTGRDANRGACSQACRYKYYLMEEKRPGEFFEVIEDDRGSYVMNSKDLCLIEYIDKMIEAGVYSLKIEGRMKSAYYVAAVVKAYRQAVDAYLEDPENYKFNPEWMDSLMKVSHRDYHTGFFFGKTGEQIYETASYIRTADIVGRVKEYDKDTQIAVIEQRNKFYDNDIVEILRPEGPAFNVQVTDMREMNGTKIDAAPRAQMLFTVKVDKELKPNDFIVKAKEQ